MVDDLTIADRRGLIARARTDPAFLARLQQDGVATIAEATGVTLPSSMTVHVVEEPGDGHYIGALPRRAALAGGLPAPTKVRDLWDNLLLSSVFSGEDARAELIGDPIGYVRGLTDNFPGTRFDVLEETAGDTYLVIDSIGAADDELEDFALDMIAGGGNPPCVDPNEGPARSNKDQV